MSLLLYASLFVLGIGLHVVGALFLMALVDDATARSIGRKFIAIFLTALHRPLLTVNMSNNLTLKRWSYDEQLDEKTVSFGGLFDSVTRVLRDPRDRLHRFYGVKFGFADEYSGLVFDPRDADAGKRTYEHMEAGSLRYFTDAMNSSLPTAFIRAVYELPRGMRGVELRRVWHLIGGSGNSQYTEWLDKMYAEGQEPRSDSLGFWQLMAPVAAFIGVMAVGAFVADATSSGGGGGSAPTVNIGLLFLLAIPDWKRPSWRPIYRTYLVVAAGALGGAALLWLAVSTVPVGILLPSLVAFTLGLVIVPFVAYFLGRSLGGLGLALGKLYAIVGLYPFRDPVINLGADDRYTVEEWAEIDEGPDPQWYRFAKTWLGVTYDNDGPDVWPGREAAIEADRLGEYVEDDVDDAPEVLPPGTAPAMSRAGHRGYAPKTGRLDDDAVYLKSGHALSWFREVGRGRLLMRALKNAKEDHFGGNQEQRSFVRRSVIAMTVLGALFNWLVFF